MPTASARTAVLDRAYVQSRVVETGLDRLSAQMSEIDPELQARLSECVSVFDDYVRCLRDAKKVADAQA